MKKILSIMLLIVFIFTFMSISTPASALTHRFNKYDAIYQDLEVVYTGDNTLTIVEYVGDIFVL